MTNRTCPACHASFDGSQRFGRVQGALGGAVTGAYLAGGVGLVLGPLGILGTALPGALLGSALGWLGVSRLARCPACTTTGAVAGR